MIRAGRLTRSIPPAIERVLPEPVTPSRVTPCSPPSRASAMASMAAGWSPAAGMSLTSLNAGLGGNSPWLEPACWPGTSSVRAGWDSRRGRSLTGPRCGNGRVGGRAPERPRAGSVMESFVIKGGQPLSAPIRPSGKKNAALPILAACLLAEEPVVLRNVPKILDVETMLELVASTGAGVERHGPNPVRTAPRGLRRATLDPALCTRIRASVLRAAPLVARTGHCLLPPPGGDVIGRRRLDTHLLAFRSLGVHASFDRALELEVGRLRGGSMFLHEAAVPAPENAVMAAGLAKGETVIGNAACEPHVQDLCRFLVGLGARISGIGSNL